jgi:hypothetical protein
VGVYPEVTDLRVSGGKAGSGRRKERRRMTVQVPGISTGVVPRPTWRPEGQQWVNTSSQCTDTGGHVPTPDCQTHLRKCSCANWYCLSFELKRGPALVGKGRRLIHGE